MNKMRRKELANLIADLRCVKDKDDIYDAINTLEYIKSDEEYYYDNIPENLQNSQRAYDSQEAIDNMDDALDFLNMAYDATENEDMTQPISKAIEKINLAKF